MPPFPPSGPRAGEAPGDLVPLLLLLLLWPFVVVVPEPVGLLLGLPLLAAGQYRKPSSREGPPKKTGFRSLGGRPTLCVKGRSVLLCVQWEWNVRRTDHMRHVPPN